MHSVWRLIQQDPPARPGAWNMALDEALLESVEQGGAPALRLYGWQPACLSLGRNQPARERFDARAAAERGIDVVRRPTGGGAVLHDRELTYAAVLPVGLLGPPRGTHEQLNRALVAGLRGLGVPSTLSPARGTTPNSPGVPSSGPDICFQAAAPGEVVVAGRKLIGSAQRCRRRIILQHGSLLLDGDQRPVAELATGVAGSSAEPPLDTGETTLASLLGQIPPWAELVATLAGGFEEVLGIHLARTAPTAAEQRRAGELAQRFASAEWTWRL